MITRLGVVISLKDIISDKKIPIVSAAIFGIVHYWGTPGGIVGILFAGFLGWFLTKSIIEYAVFTGLGSYISCKMW